jgi:hypothetical protein
MVISEGSGLNMGGIMRVHCIILKDAELFVVFLCTVEPLYF